MGHLAVSNYKLKDYLNSRVFITGHGIDNNLG